MGHNKLDCYFTLWWKSLPRTNTPAYWIHLKVTKKMKRCEWGTIRQTATLSYAGMPGTNTVAYWAIHKLQRK